MPPVFEFGTRKVIDARSWGSLSSDIWGFWPSHQEPAPPNHPALFKELRPLTSARFQAGALAGVSAASFIPKCWAPAPSLGDSPVWGTPAFPPCSQGSVLSDLGDSSHLL